MPQPCDPQDDAVRAALLLRLKKQCSSKMSMVSATLATTRFGSASRREVEHSFDVALALGIRRAAFDKWLAYHGISKEEWRAYRVECGHSSEDRQEDLHLVLHRWPEFDEYRPELSEDEIIRAAQTEFRDYWCAPGSDHHAYGPERRMLPEGGVYVNPYAMAVAIPVDPISQAGDTADVIDGYSSYFTANREAEQLLTSDKYVLGPMHTHVTAVAITEFGELGLIWAMSKFGLGKRHSDLVRMFCREDIDKKEFERIKKVIGRKLPQIDKVMAEKLKADERFQALCETLLP